MSNNHPSTSKLIGLTMLTAKKAGLKFYEEQLGLRGLELSLFRGTPTGTAETAQLVLLHVLLQQPGYRALLTGDQAEGEDHCETQSSVRGRLQPPRFPFGPHNSLSGRKRSVVELDTIASACINEASAIAAALLLVLFLGKSLALGDNQVLVRLAAPVVGVIREAVRLELFLNSNVPVDT